MSQKRAWVQVQQPGRPEPEAGALLVELPGRGFDTRTFTRKRLVRRQLPLDRHTLVAGEIDLVRSALAQLDIEPPILPTYPASLLELLRRRIWAARMDHIIDQVLERGEPIFVKPAQKEKRFTGFVLRDSGDLYFLRGASRRTEVLCSEVVSWKREYRAYVVHGEVRAICQYNGEPGPVPAGLAREAATRMDAAGEAVAAYAVDVGVLDDDREAVVEVNDGFGLGRYEPLSEADYADVICARWAELTTPRLDNGSSASQPL